MKRKSRWESSKDEWRPITFSPEKELDFNSENDVREHSGYESFIPSHDILQFKTPTSSFNPTEYKNDSSVTFDVLPPKISVSDRDTLWGSNIENKSNYNCKMPKSSFSCSTVQISDKEFRSKANHISPRLSVWDKKDNRTDLQNKKTHSSKSRFFDCAYQNVVNRKDSRNNTNNASSSSRMFDKRKTDEIELESKKNYTTRENICYFTSISDIWPASTEKVAEKFKDIQENITDFKNEIEHNVNEVLEPNTKNSVPNTKNIEPNTQNIEPNIKNIELNMKNIEPNTKNIEPNMKNIEQKKIVLKHCILYPPKLDNLKIEIYGNKSHTIFISNLPNKTTELIIQEIFQQFGKIKSILLIGRNCQVTYLNKYSARKAQLKLYGYKLQIKNNHDINSASSINIKYASSINIKYAEPDFYDFPHGQRFIARCQLDKEYKDKAFVFSRSKAKHLLTKLKNEEEYLDEIPILVEWLKKGYCNKDNKGLFFEMLKVLGIHAKRLKKKTLMEKIFYNMAILPKLEKFNLISLQLDDVCKFFDLVKLQKSKFSVHQQKYIDNWSQTMKEIRNVHYQELIEDREVEEKEVSDSENRECSKLKNDCVKNIKNYSGSSAKKVNHAMDFSNHKNDFEKEPLLKFDSVNLMDIKSHSILNMEKVKDEVDLSDQESETCYQEIIEEDDEGEISPSDNDESQIMSESLQDKVVNQNNDIKIDYQNEKCNIEISLGQNSEEKLDSYNLTDDKNLSILHTEKLNTNLLDKKSESMKSDQNLLFSQQEIRLIVLISTFLLIYPNGTNVKSICQYLTVEDPSINEIYVENLLRKFPYLFKEHHSDNGEILIMTSTFR